MSRLEVLFLAWNRLAYTRVSFGCLRANTDWSLVDRLVVYDDGSEDGTLEFLRAATRDVPVPTELREVEFRSPPWTLNDYVAKTEADVFVKIDNDIAVPPGWLPTLLDTAERHPHYHLIGFLAGFTGVAPSPDVPHTVRRAPYIGGVGFMRTAAFRSRPAITVNFGGSKRRDGFTLFQQRQRMVSGWITPDLRAPQLDHIPVEPWWSLSRMYVAKGWQRDWPPYDPVGHYWWDWIDPILLAEEIGIT